MSINLITDPWLPVRRLSGRRDVVRSADITSDFVGDPILALDFPRPDWNAAVTEMLIGLLACVMAPEDDEEWADLWAAPPPPEELHAKLAPLAFAFNLGGDGPRCFQDLDPLTDSEEKPINGLLIDAPGAIALTKNTDLFVKRTEEPCLSPGFAAAALITLQTYAPSGGQGNRTSMRGGGPLTTLPLPLRILARPGDAHVVTTLWDTVWASVPARDGVVPLPASHEPQSWARIFPWLAAARTSEKDRATLPEHGHPLQCFFATPRRIRIDFVSSGGQTCGLGGGAHETVARSFRQKNYGVKYEGWRHPLSPHRSDKKAGKLPRHPQPDSGTYRDWLTWVEQPADKETEPATCVAAWPSRLQWLRRTGRALPPETRADPWRSGLLACGYDMDNMKARGWLEARIPFFDPPPDAPAEWSAHFMATAKKLVAGADAAAGALRFRARLAAFGQPDRESGTYTLPKMSPGKDAYQDLFETFWRETEPNFLDALKTLRNDGVEREVTHRVRERFLKALRSKALHLFDLTVGTDDLADQDARRIVDARSRLAFAFGETGDVTDALDIISAEARQKNAKRKAKKKGATA